MKRMNIFFRAWFCVAGALTASLAQATIESATLESACVRFDGRVTFGSRLVRGVEILGETDGSAASSWDSATRADGWHTLTSGSATTEIYVQNAAMVTVEGGRLVDTHVVWASNTTHVVRNWVVVPSGTTLEIAAGTIVKFCPDVGIRIEEGGTLNVAGEVRADVIFTTTYDDSVGAVLDCARIPEQLVGGIQFQSEAATFIDNPYIQVRGFAMRGFPYVSLNDTRTFRTEKFVRIPVTITGERDQRFSIDWELTRPNETYALESGTIVWVDSTAGTQWITVPIESLNVTDETKHFTIRFTIVRGANVGKGEATITIQDHATRLIETSYSVESADSRLDGRSDFGGKIVYGTEKIGDTDGGAVRAWDTKSVADGWRTVESGSASDELYVMNDTRIVVEGGRLRSGIVEWSSHATHVVRNWVVVPNGTTLKVTTNAVVKMCGGVGIRVEDGGRLEVVGAEGADAIFTSVADDTVGASVDCGDFETDAVGGVRLQSDAATLIENNFMQMRGFTMGRFPSVSLSDTTAIRNGGVAYVPVTISGAREKPFSVAWEAVDGTAKFGEDFTLAGGTVKWSGTSEGKKWIVIPLVATNMTGETRSFTLRLKSGSSANIATGEAVITIEEREAMKLEWGSATECADVRFDGRADNLGGCIVYGTNTVGEIDGHAVCAWDTTVETDGWHTVTSGTNTTELCVLNDTSISVEGGRLATGTIVWSNDVTHVVRNWVVVPSGTTLLVVTNAVVKFCPSVGIRVEDGGRLSVIGREGGDVVFTSAFDDTVGAKVDCGEMTDGAVGGIQLQTSSAAITENAYMQARGFTVSAFSYVSLNDTEAFRSAGEVRVPFTISGSRSTAFSLDWVAVDGTAKFGEDFTLASGIVSWTGTSQGTKWITIPLVTDPAAGETRTFTLKITAARGANISDGEAMVTIREEGTAVVSAGAAVESSDMRFDAREDLGGRLLFGTEAIGEADGASVRLWDTTTVADGWHSVSSGTNTESVCVVNDENIAVEGGCLSTGIVEWTDDVTHVVRNWVVVPSGTTLRVVTNAVVKLCPGVGIRIEDGGKLEVVGSEERNVIFTTAFDDTVGAKVDCGEMTDGTVGGIQVQSSAATMTDNNYMQIRGFHVNGLPYLTIHNTTAFRAKGKVYVPITISGSRTAPFTADWMAIDGTAKLNEDYLLGRGTLKWNSTSDGTKWLEIPLVAENVTGNVRTFTLKLLGGCGSNISVSEALITIEEHGFEALTWGTARECAGGRYDDRQTLGAKIVCGVESVGEADGSAVYAWHTAEAADGWRTLTSGTNEADLCVLNSSAVAVEGGRLGGESVEWRGDKTHVVRNWVVVPSGTTLTIHEGTIVKFCPEAGIRVEDGGKLEIVGSAENHVMMTTAFDDGLGTPVDYGTMAAAAVGGIRLQSGAATLSENGHVQIRGFTLGAFPSVRVGDVLAFRSQGKAFIPFTVTGSRTKFFTAEWVAVDSTAKYGEDYTLASGTLEWENASEGTKWLEIPLVPADVGGEIRRFAVRIRGGCGISIADGEAEIQVRDQDFSTLTWDRHQEEDVIRFDAIQPAWSSGSCEIAYSPAWCETGDSVTVALTSAQGETTELVPSTSEGGVLKWHAASLAEGIYTLTHTTRSATGAVVETLTSQVVLIRKDVFVKHDGLPHSINTDVFDALASCDDPATVTYATSETGPWTATPETFTEIGTNVVWYKAAWADGRQRVGAVWLVIVEEFVTTTGIPYAIIETAAQENPNVQALLTACNGDYETFVARKAANSINSVGDCLVIGIDPTDETAKFKALIEMGADGLPQISWEPDLGGERNYTVEGRASLTEGGWEEADETKHRFFRVRVELK